MKNNQKVFVSIILIAVVIIGGYFIVTAKKPVVQETIPVNEMTDWKTYTNTQHGFEFSYPENLEIVEEFDKKDVNLNPEDPESKTFDWFSLHLSDHRDRQIFNFSISINEPGRDFPGAESVSRTRAVIGGIQAEKNTLQISEGEDKGDKSALYNFKKDDDDYMIYATGTYEKADQILSTFKFTK